MFEFHYKIKDGCEEDEVRHEINDQRRKEKKYYEEQGVILDKSRIPKGKYCNDEKMCCPYCVLDSCLLYGGKMMSTWGCYGFSTQKRKKQCIEQFLKGKDLTQVEIVEDGETE